MIKVGVVGLGQFAPRFLGILHAHPEVEQVYACDVIEERLRRVADVHDLTRRFTDYDELLRSDVDAVAIFTQRWMHGPHALAALRAGKHVFSAVPMGVSVDEVRQLVDVVRTSGLTYMMGETSYYYPAVVYCRRRFQRGDFGHVVYAEGEYLHDMSHGFYAAYQNSGGADWKRTASFPPLLYSTHSLSSVLGVTGSYATSVSALGYVDREGDGVFDREVSWWGNDFSNATALFSTADGAAMRINEMRRVGIPEHRPEVRVSVFGTKASFEQQTGMSVMQTLDGFDDITAELHTSAAAEESPAAAEVDASLRASFGSGFSSVHDRSKLPVELLGRPNGHEGSHQFLIHDFVTAVVEHRLPPVNAWVAARYTVPGIVAHQSAIEGGRRLPVPDLGDPPDRAPAAALGGQDVEGA